jgi:hypothetical protein
MNWIVKMENTNWLKQKANEPLFKDLLWSRPENRAHAGKLLVIGGNKHALAAPGVAFGAAEKAGIGSSRVLLPYSTKKLVGKIFPEAEFAPNTPSGSFSRKSLGQFLESAQWADGVLLAGDFGRNSETAILLESFADKYNGHITVAQDGVDYFLQANSLILQRDNTCLVSNLGKLQKLAKNNRPGTPILNSMSLHELVSILTDWTNSSPISFVTIHAGQALIAHSGKASTTPISRETNWQVELPAYISTWWLQLPKKTFEALTAAIYNYESKN